MQKSWFWQKFYVQILGLITFFNFHVTDVWNGPDVLCFYYMMKDSAVWSHLILFSIHSWLINTYTARPVCWREWISWQLL